MPSAPPPHVLWLPAHPSEGAVSMDRYWRELDRQARPDAAAIRCALGQPPDRTRRAGWLKRGWHKYAAYPWQARRAAADPGIRVVHVLDHSFAPLLRGMARPGLFKIATVHDLAPLRDGSDLTPSQNARFRRAVEHLRLADLVLADSRHSAGEAVELLALDPAKVRVLPLGVDCARFARRSSSDAPAWLPALADRRVVLSVGSTIARKNLRALPEIFRALRALAPAERVVLLRIGDPLPGALRAELDGVLGGGGVFELGRVDDLALASAYQRADALLFPSWLEGFGFPVLEAMAASCPVVCTDVTSLPEVGGEAALYFDPAEPAFAAAQLARLFAEPALRAEHVARGLAQAVALSWAEHWKTLREIYATATTS